MDVELKNCSDISNSDNLKKILHNHKKHNNVFTSSSPSSSNSSFKCNNPATPAMQHTSKRVMTYINWPHHIKATPFQLAQAGLFYLGKLDRVKCFNCGGGLQKFDYNEDPWHEHAKWYPTCEFVLQSKGMQYVKDVVSACPDLKRPKINSSISLISILADTSSCCASLRPFHSENAIEDCIESHTHLIDSIKNKVKAAMMKEIVKEVSGYGFEIHLVEKVVEDKLLKFGEEYKTVFSLVEDLQIQEKEQDIIQCTSLPSTSSSSTSSLEISSTNEVEMFDACSSVQTKNEGNHIQEEEEEVEEQWTTVSPPAGLLLLNNCQQPLPKLTKIFPKREKSIMTNINARELHREVEANPNNLSDLENEQTCKVCLDRKINCLFTPCNHLVCCVQCASALTKCPLCRAQLVRIIKIYRD